MHKTKGKLSGVLHKGFKPDKWSVHQIGFRLLPRRAGVRRVWEILTSALVLLWFPQQDVAADGGGADQAAAEPQGGAGAPDAPRGRAAARGQPGHDRAHQGTCLAHGLPRHLLPSPLHHPIIICHFTPSHWSELT